MLADAGTTVHLAELRPDDVVAQHQVPLAAQHPFCLADAPIARYPAHALVVGAEASVRANACHVSSIFEQSRRRQEFRGPADSSVAAGFAPAHRSTGKINEVYARGLLVWLGVQKKDEAGAGSFIYLFRVIASRLARKPYM